MEFKKPNKINAPSDGQICPSEEKEKTKEGEDLCCEGGARQPEGLGPMASQESKATPGADVTAPAGRSLRSHSTDLFLFVPFIPLALLFGACSVMVLLWMMFMWFMYGGSNA